MISHCDITNILQYNSIKLLSTTLGNIALLIRQNPDLKVI